MLEEGEVKQIISHAINSAICIDDQYIPPYSQYTEADKKFFEDAGTLYTSFRRDGNCSVDIYKFSDLDSFERDREFLFNHKDLMILDWELNNSDLIKYRDSLHVLEEALNDKNIRCVTIYTQEDNKYQILLNIYAHFLQTRSSSLQALNERIESIESETEKIFDDNDEDGLFNEVQSRCKMSSSGYTIQQKENQTTILSNFRKEVSMLIPPQKKRKICGSIKRSLCEYEISDQALLSYYEIHRGIQDRIIVPVDLIYQNDYCISILNQECISINNTIIYVINKREVTPEDVYNSITKTIYDIPNHKSLLLSLLIKDALSKDLATIGKGLGGITDNALLHHWQNYENKDIDDLIEFIAKIIKEDTSEAIQNSISKELLRKIITNEDGTEIVAKNEDLAFFNRIITFTEKHRFTNQTNHKLRTGDIFKVKTPLYIKDDSNGNTEEYIICISQSCSCAHPDKIKHNYAFGYGKTGISLDNAISQLEEVEDFSIISENKVIEWTNIFFTIHDRRFISIDINKDFLTLINNQETLLEYMGNLKEFYAQRIVNKIFKYALRIGVDLPHVKSDESDEKTD